MKKYYFEQYWGTCTERCMVKDDATMIGSVACKLCENCVDYDKDSHWETKWIKCSKLELATGNE